MKTLDRAPEPKVQGENIRASNVRGEIEGIMRDYRLKASKRLGISVKEFPDTQLDDLMVQRVLDACDSVKVVDNATGVHVAGGVVIHHPV